MKRIITSILVSVLAASVVAGEQKPNIILIMVDDMGFSDIGCYGGEIQTPNMDQMAKEGMRFSRFYNTSRCCPTRAAMLTGLYAHQTGIGFMTGAAHNKHKQNAAYSGALNRKCVTIAEALKPAGYATFMTGKWHLGETDQSMWPLQRGFEKYYGCVYGGCRYFDPVSPRHILYMNERDEVLQSTTDRPWYTTDAFTDYAIRFITEEKSGEDRPFFLYLAYNAPHWPLQAHEEDIDKYREVYSMGWDVLREQRYKRQIELGLIDPKWPLSPRDEKVQAWQEIKEPQKELEALRMAVYAAMIDRVDQNIGKLRRHLESMGKAENTLILFLSDNGACQEGSKLAKPLMADIQERNAQTSAGSNQGRGWANASNTPFRLFKHYSHEGGTSTPFIMYWPNGIKPQQDWYRSTAHILDVMPTCLDLAGAEWPKSMHGSSIPPLSGTSLTPAMSGRPLERSRPLFNEHDNNACIVDGDWKLVGEGVSAGKKADPAKWELYNLKEDRTEQHNLVSRYPERAAAMSAAWNEWAGQVGVFPKPEKNKKKAKK